MSRVVHFEIHAENPEHAVKFYTAVLGWQFKKWDGPMDYWLIMTGDETPGINGGLLRRQGPAPVEGQCVNSYVSTVGVQSVDAAVALVTANGGMIAVPKMPVPTIGWLAYGKDTEGNIFGMMQPDSTAK
jgi:predicted enzyme related to lactoylglutathione lyase